MYLPRPFRKPQPGGRQVNWANPITAGLSGLWLFDDPGDGTNGGTQKDLCRRFDGTHVGGVSIVTSARGRVLSFDGSAGRIVCTGFVLRPSGSGVTLACWASSTNFTQNGMLIEKTPVNASYELFFDSSGFLFLRGGSTSGISIAVPSAGWHHFVGTIDGSGNAVIYLDGVAVSSGAISAPADPAGDLNIGDFDNGGGYFFNGLIDMPAVWNRVLSAAEVQRLYVDPYCLVRPKLLPLADAVVAGLTAAQEIGIFDQQLAGGMVGLTYQ